MRKGNLEWGPRAHASHGLGRRSPAWRRCAVGRRDRPVNRAIVVDDTLVARIFMYPNVAAGRVPPMLSVYADGRVSGREATMNEKASRVR